MVATNIGCKRLVGDNSADPLYLSIACLKDDASAYRGQLFRSDNCSGEVAFELENRFPACDSKVTSYQCMPEQTDSSFGNYKGLFT